MPETGAGRQQAWRDRRARVRRRPRSGRARLRAGLAGPRGQLAGALTEAGRRAARQCKHPAAAAGGGRCRACGTDAWWPVPARRGAT
jgi:hypothetical protein